MRYDRRGNKLIIGNKPSRANYLNISYLRKLTRPTAASSTLDVEDQWFELLNLKMGEQYAESMAFKIAQQGNVSVEEGHLRMANLRALASDNAVKFENLKRKLKPVMPSMTIPYYIHGGGNV